MTEHTALPWELNTLNGRIPAIREIKSSCGEASRYQATIIVEGDPPFNFVCELDFGYGKPEDEANARFIVTACNCHADLLEACKDAQASIIAMGDYDDVISFESALSLLNSRNILAEAIRKVEEIE